jgi:hypothetical protein
MGGAKCAKLSFDRLTPAILPVVRGLVGQFRSAGGLVLLSGGKLGPQIFLPLVPLTFPTLILTNRRFQEKNSPRSNRSRNRGLPRLEGAQVQPLK